MAGPGGLLENPPFITSISPNTTAGSSNEGSQTTSAFYRVRPPFKKKNFKKAVFLRSLLWKTLL